MMVSISVASERKTRVYALHSPPYLFNLYSLSSLSALSLFCNFSLSVHFSLQSPLLSSLLSFSLLSLFSVSLLISPPLSSLLLFLLLVPVPADLMVISRGETREPLECPHRQPEEETRTRRRQYEYLKNKMLRILFV